MVLHQHRHLHHLHLAFLLLLCLFSSSTRAQDKVPMVQDAAFDFVSLISPTGAEPLQKGVPVLIQWTPTSKSVSLSLMNGLGNNILDVMTIATDIPGGSSRFRWTPPTSLESGTEYCIKLSSDGLVDYTPMLEIVDGASPKGVAAIWTTAEPGAARGAAAGDSAPQTTSPSSTSSIESSISVTPTKQTSTPVSLDPSTSPSPSSSFVPSSSGPSATVIGGAVGGILSGCLVALILAFLIIGKRKGWILQKSPESGGILAELQGEKRPELPIGIESYGIARELEAGHVPVELEARRGSAGDGGVSTSWLGV